MKKMLLIALLTVMASMLSAAKLSVKNSKDTNIYVKVKVKNSSGTNWSSKTALMPGESTSFNYPGKKILKYKWKKHNRFYKSVKYSVGIAETKNVEIK